MIRKIYIAPFLLVFLLGSGCKKFLDVNTDPNNPKDVQESLLLVSIETATATTVVGGSWTTGNYSTVAVTDAYLVQQLALNQLPPQTDEYLMRSADYDQMFLTMYSTVLENLRIMNGKAEENGNHSYGVIAKVLNAYNLGIITDTWGDIPYSKGLAGRQHATYDKQEDVYNMIQSILDSAIAENAMEPGIDVPEGDDFIYNGDMALWEKFAYTLKARNYLHLTKAPGHDAVTQSNLALAALENGFTSQDDEANFTAFSTAAGAEGPWYLNIDPGQGGVVLSSTLIDSLVSRNDPRLSILATKGSDDTYLGKRNGSDPAPDVTVYSIINDFYAAADAPVSFLNYSEALFIKAEAIYRTQGFLAAEPIYIEAINSHMSKLGLDPTSDEVLTYLAGRLPLTEDNALQHIIEDKVVANFLSTENYNDWRRTGFPVLTLAENPYIPSIPRRFPYPLGEETANPQPEHSLGITDRMWWDTE